MMVKIHNASKPPPLQVTLEGFPSELSADLMKLHVNLVPYQRLHFFCPSLSPILSASNEGSKPAGLGSLVERLFFTQGFLAECDPSLGRFITAAAFFRGTSSVSELGRELKRTVPRFVDFAPNGVKCALSPAAGRGPHLSAVLLANTTAVQEVFRRQLGPHLSMSRRSTFLHRYDSEGVEFSDFIEAGRSVGQLISDYLQYQGTPCL